MADYDVLKSWLKGIDLPQYFTTFLQHGFTQRDQCKNLDDETLVQIGVTLPGHRRRILSNLPTVDSGSQNRQDIQPDLPPKTKSPRDSYLFQDVSPSQLGIMNDIGTKPQKEHAANDSDYENFPTKEEKRETPRPVPRPRPRARGNKPKDSPPKEGGGPKPAKRPTPAPRHSTSPHIKNTFDNNDSTISSNIPGDIPTSATTDSENVKNNTCISVKLDGVCIDETSTDSSGTCPLYSYPIKDRSSSPQCTSPQNKQISDITPKCNSLSSDGLDASDLNKGTEENMYENTNSESQSINIEEEYYMNIETDLPSKQKVSGQELHIGKELPQSQFKENMDALQGFSPEEENVNADFDPNVRTFNIKYQEQETETIRNSFDQKIYSSGEFAQDLSELNKNDTNLTLQPQACISNAADDNDELYEPIWADKKVNSSKTTAGIRSSSLMQFSPSPNNTEFEFRSSLKTTTVSPLTNNRVSSFHTSKNRDLASFDLPPPRFAPPPLPSQVSSMNDVIADFDPLSPVTPQLSASTSSQAPAMPPIPPRPVNYTRPATFKPYENVTFPLSADSTTLPGHHNMEPEADMFTSPPIGYQDARVSMTDDPFQNMDPFAEFVPDASDFEVGVNSAGKHPPHSHKNTKDDGNNAISDAIYDAPDEPQDFDPFGLKQKETRIDTSSTNVTSEAIYEEPGEPDSFDPFGLKQKKHELPNLPQRSISNSSSTSGNSLRLSEVPPAPNSNQSALANVNMSMYSLAGTILDTFNEDSAAGDYENFVLFKSTSFDNLYENVFGMIKGMDLMEKKSISSCSDQVSLCSSYTDDDSCSDVSLDDMIDRSVDHDIDPPGNMAPVNVDILPSNALSPRRRERSGYLYKQGGIKQNRGWRKRWVIFDGKTLRYYSNAKDQVSKRIVPLSCMTNVEMDVKLKDLLAAAADKRDLLERSHTRVHVTTSDLFDFSRRLSRKNSDPANNSRQFKFKLHCTNRVFLFATDNLDDCKMWSSTMMEAILTYNKPEGGEVPGGDMANPDIADWIKIGKNRYKFYVALKKHKLCYYQNIDDYNMASPLHEIDMKLSAVKEMDRTKLQLATHYSTFMFHFESSPDASNWKMAIEEAITDALGDNTILDQVKENAANAKCADCGAKDAHWASMTLCIVLCLRCAGIHRGFDPKLSKIRSLRMDTKVWNSSLLEMFKVIGNNNANLFWLKHLPDRLAIRETTPSDERKLHLVNKYKNKKFCDKHPFSDDKTKLNEALLASAQTDNVLLTMQILLSGAEVLYTKPGSPDTTAFEVAKEAHQRIQMEFLLQNGGDKTKNFYPGSEEAALVAKMRAEVQLHGYLYKTGSDMKAFLKRWCILEHGHLSYFVGEESKVEKDRIDNDCILCVQATSHDKNPVCFEISSKRNNRVYLFAAADQEERLKWMRAIAQVFCPVNLMEQIKLKDLSLAGYAYMKTGFNMDWQRTWYVLENKRLYFTDKGQQHERHEDSLDLRKVTSISKITQSIIENTCEGCLEQGPQLVLSAPDIALYFQSDIAKDTDRMYNCLEVAVKKGGDNLEDQVLNTDEIPVIISSCINFIQHNGLEMRGLYREAAQESKVKTLLKRFHDDARAVVLRTEDHTVHEVCNVFKRFLRNLTDPLLTTQLYRRWVETAGETDHNSKLQWYKYLLQQLPRVNYLTLRCLAKHLHKLSKHAKVNLMTVDNISIAFGSSLMKSNKEESTLNPNSIGSSMQLEMRVISDIVTYYEWLFDVQESVDKQNTIERRIQWAEEKLKQITSDPRKSVAPVNEMIIWVYYLDPNGNAESVKITKETTVSEVISSLISKLNLTSTGWSLHEVIKREIERPLHASVKLWPLIHEWQNWTSDYCADAALCLRSNELREKIEKAYEPCKPLFAEMKYCEKKKGSKMAFEFTQAKLSYYKDTKSMSHPAGSWNIEDLCIYKGCDPKRTMPTKWAFTFLSKGDKVGEKELPYFGRAVFCNSENDLLSWLASMMMAQHPSGFS